MKCHNLEKKIHILTENADGDLYMLEANSFNEIMDDWNGDCDFIPANDARVYFASLDGTPINPHGYTNFESLLRYLQPTKTKKVVLRGVYNLGGEYLPFEDNPLHGKTYNNVEVSFSKKTRGTGDHKFVVDVVNIEGCEPIECELVGHHTAEDGTLVIAICQDWG